MSIRKHRRNLHRWFRYYRKYEPWHLETPGLEKAYNRWTRACKRQGEQGAEKWTEK